MENITPKTELLYPKSEPIDLLKLQDAIILMIEEQKKASDDIRKSISKIEVAINKIYSHLCQSSSGRLIYVGAGTSGRIGIQDGVELASWLM